MKEYTTKIQPDSDEIIEIKFTEHRIRITFKLEKVPANASVAQPYTIAFKLPQKEVKSHRLKSGTCILCKEGTSSYIKIKSVHGTLETWHIHKKCHKRYSTAIEYIQTHHSDKIITRKI